jgi:hypothetical protein
MDEYESIHNIENLIYCIRRNSHEWYDSKKTINAMRNTWKTTKECNEPIMFSTILLNDFVMNIEIHPSGTVKPILIRKRLLE